MNPRELALYELSRPAHSARLCDLSESEGATIRAASRYPFQKPNQYSQTAHDEQIWGKRDVPQIARPIDATAVLHCPIQHCKFSTPAPTSLYCLSDSQRAASLAK